MAQPPDLSHLPLRRQPRQQRSRDKVLRALAAAEHLLDAEGPAAVNLTRVAHAAGLTPGALHQYLPDHDALLAAVRARAHHRLERLLADALSSPSPSDPIAGVLSGIVAVYRDSAALRLGRMPSTSRASQAHHDRMVATLATLLAELDLCAPDRSALVARTLFFAVDGVVREAFRTASSGEAAVLTELDHLVRAYLGSGAPRREGDVRLSMPTTSSSTRR